MTAVAVSSLITERINISVGLLGLVIGGLVAGIGMFVLPPKSKEES